MVVSNKWQRVIIQKFVQMQDHVRDTVVNIQQHYMDMLKRRQRWMIMAKTKLITAK